MQTKKLMLPAIIMTSLFGLVACDCDCGSSDSSGADNATNNTKVISKKDDGKGKKPTVKKNDSKDKKPKEKKPIIKKGGSSSSGSKEIKFYSIDDDYDNGKIQYLELVEYVFRDGNIKFTPKTIIGDKNKQNISNDDRYYLAPNFEAMALGNEDKFIKQVDKTIKVLSANNFTWQVKSKTGKALTTSLVLDEVDISGKTEKDVNILSLDVPRIGNNKVSYTMPKGSSCYVSHATYSIPHLFFEEDDISSYKSVKEWYDAETKFLPTSRKLIGKKVVQVGDNNQYEATYLELAKSNPNDGKHAIDEYPAIVEYKGKLYDARYILKEEYKDNTDTSKGKVYCDNYNQTGAEYLVNLAKKYAKK